MIDTQTAIQRVKTGTAPASWQVSRASRSFFLWSVLGGVALMTGAVAAAIYLYLSGTIVGIGVNDETPDGLALLWFIVDMLILAALTITGIVFAIRRAIAIGTASEQMLILMPEGFVKRTGTAARDTLAVNYATIAAVTASADNGPQVLVMDTSAGQRLKVEIDGRFSHAKALKQQIAGQHAHYLATAAAQASTGLLYE